MNAQIEFPILSKESWEKWQKNISYDPCGKGKTWKELEELKLVRRPEVVERIKIARSYGDLSENSEYEAAKDEQAFVEGQISSLETKITYAEIVNSGLSC